MICLNDNLFQSVIFSVDTMYDDKTSSLTVTPSPGSVGTLIVPSGFRVNSGEYKLMGLAPYGDSSSKEVAEFANTIKTELVQIMDDGSI